MPGCPFAPRGEAVGTLCAIDFKPRTWSEDDLGVLADLAGGATAELQLLAATRTVARHSASLQALTRLSNGLATAQTADDVLRELLPALERFHASAVRLLLTDESGHALRTAAATDGSRHADLPLTPAEVAPDFLLTRADLPDRLDALLEDQPDVAAVALLPLTAGDSRDRRARLVLHTRARVLDPRSGLPDGCGRHRRHGARATLSRRYQHH